ncbi:MAG TPA: hypothetical protein VFZ78_04765 [Flavisolibacter sp.]
MGKLLTFCVFGCFSLQLHAQVVEASSAEHEFIIHSVKANATASQWHSGIIRMDNGDIVAPAELKDNDYAIVGLDAYGALQWKTKLPGKAVGMGSVKDRILAFYLTEHEHEAYAVLLDAQTGGILKESRLAGGGYRIHLFAQTEDGGKLQYLLVRTTRARDRRPPYYWGLTESLQLLRFNDDGELSGTTAIGLPPDSWFMGSACAGPGHFFIATYSETRIRVDRFTGGGEPAGTLDIAVDNEILRRMACYQMAVGGNKDYVVLTTRQTMGRQNSNFRMFGFDFSAGKTFAAEPEKWDRKYAYSISYEKVPGITGHNMIEPTEFYSTLALTTPDKIIVVKEGLFRWSRYFTNQGLVVSFYDYALNPLKTIGVNKVVITPHDQGQSIGHRIVGDSLTLVSATSYYGGFDVGIFRIDVKNMKFSRAFRLDKVSAAPIEPGNTVWSGDSMLLNFLARPRKSTKPYMNSLFRNVTF